MQAATRSVIESVHPLLTRDDVENATVLNDAGEWEVALELICVQLDEYDAVLTATQFELLSSACLQAEVCDSYWKDLNPTAT